MAQDVTREKKSRRSRAALALLVLFALLVAGMITAANVAMDTGRQRMQRGTEQDLNTRAANTAANLTVWAGRLKNQIETFASLDMLRLFAAEIDNAKIPADALQRLSATTIEDVTSGVTILSGTDDPVEGSEGAPRQNELKYILPRLPLMVSQLKEFAAKNNFLDAHLLNSNVENLLSPDGVTPMLNDEQKEMMKGIFTSKMPLFMPVRPYEDGVAMDVAFPVLAPLYLASDEHAVAVLLVTCDVTQVLREVTRGDMDKNYFNSCVMQIHDNRLQILSDAPGKSAMLDLPDWPFEVRRGLAFGLREMPVVSDKPLQVYSVALPVSGLSWYAAEMLNADKIEVEYANYRRNVIIITSLAIALAAIVLAALWWWALGRRERAIATEMRHLYQIVHQQKQIMDGVNSALSAGIVLNDLNGIIFYTNQSFAQMTGMSQHELSGASYRSLNALMAKSLVMHTQAVYQSKQLSSFTEILSINGTSRHFLTSCSPFLSERGEMLGVVSVYNDIMDLVMAQRRAQHMVTQTVAVFVRAIEAVDPYLRGQSEFTGKLAVALAPYLGRGDEVTFATLRTAASLSHIGMIQLPRELLTKTEKLSADDRSQLQRHTEYARKALEGIDFGIPVVEAITQMYERMDGSGYPRGLKGEQISFNARILAVANTFSALMRPRSYRSAMETQQAILMLSTAPLKYDANVIQALVDFLKSDQGSMFLKDITNDREINVS